ncbi:hypothetical protein [uncultured Hymenobacter sp.]|uniref:hypothetical protein n=1 Tax=uncultured Hymenobacter sp. TaxID=170016 RepID=UPI0035CA6C3A
MKNIYTSLVFCLLFCLLLTGTAAAQTPAAAPAVAAPVSAPTPRTAADTVQAIHRLFAKRARVGGFIVLGAIGADLIAAGISAAAEGSSSGSSGGGGYGCIGCSSGGLLRFSFADYVLVYGVLAAPIMGVGIQQLVAYGPRREARIIAAYQAHHQLPAKVRRRLVKYL